jgi:transcriptional regulator with XRE-family HTH domain
MKKRSQGQSRRVVLPRPTYPDLATYIAESGDTQEHIAAVIGVTQAYISRVVAGRLVPRPQIAVALATYAKIPLDSFTLAKYAREQAAEVA